MGNEEHIKEQIMIARNIVNSCDIEKDYKIQAFAVVLSYFLACP